MHAGRLEAGAHAIDAVAGDIAGLPAGSAVPARVGVARGTIARLRGDPAAALQHLQPLAESAASAPKSQRERMRAWAQIGLARLDRGEPAQAIVAIELALKEFERLETGRTPAHADALVGLGRAHLARGDALRALAPLEKADRFWRDADPTSPSAAVAADWLARARAAQPG
jgi:tetratricopeptide (TPR) repeat protein